MKKLVVFLTFVSLLALSCNKPATNKGGNNGGGDSDYKAPITIDGDFSDWAAIDSKVTVLNCAATASKTDLKKAKVYADKYYVFVYVEFDWTAYEGVEGVNDAHFHFYINGDNDTATGGYEGAFDQGSTPCVDVMTEGDVIEGGNVVDYDPTSHTWEGPANYADWSDDYWVALDLSDFVIGKGNTKAFEFQITRELYPAGKLKNPFTMGFDILVNGWDATGALPNTEATETNTAGYAPLLEVSIVK